ncbi:SixA phosphatase family protein [Gordonia neofelifaecis]|uniref:Phosphoglycerate mutase n=1 Tax=Gordonia neofelifaecis NRRL B-59395 TaxID=644548 RepID=F1YM79_9ACTN|nr:histidine phosphatase family protein [Gordonia neofelifaecis]EGD54330.1 phosphoglycerate mutase [Gordonia neofelifaecis NRRL B-59395]
MTERTLILMRHGKSSYPDGVYDHDRPLNDRGMRQAELAGRWMADDGLDVDMVLCSTSTRTRMTLQQSGVAAPVEYVSDLYGGTPAEIFESVRIYAPASAATVLVVGHFPGMPEAALALDPDGEIDRFPTSAYAAIRIGVPWERLGLDVDRDARLLALRVPR